MPFDISEVVNDPDFAQVFTINRSSGAFSLGKWVNQTATIPGYGIITPATADELQQVPEGDRITGAITIHSSNQINETHDAAAGTTAGISDYIVWHNQQYRVAKVWPWQDFGYYKALAVRISGK